MPFYMNLNPETAANLLERLNDASSSSSVGRLRPSVGMDVEEDDDVLEEVAMDADAARKEEPM